MEQLVQKDKEIVISRETYDIPNKEKLTYKAPPGLTEELIRKISQEKNEPVWMLQKRLAGLKAYQKLHVPTWGPNLSELDISTLSLYMTPDAKKNATTWEEVPEDIKNTYEKLGIPKAEREALAGVGAQYESEVVYHNLKKEWEEQGVIFLDMDEAVKKHPDMIKKYFMTQCVPLTLHKYAALHAAVWSGGTFIYVPKGVTLEQPLQAYFRMNAKNGGQFEHTLIIVDEGAECHYIEGCSAPQYTTNSLHAGCVEVFVNKNARMRYSSIENWSKNTYNLNTKRAVVYDDAVMEWVNGNMGSKVTMLYPCSILVGDRSTADYIGIAFAGEGQYQDTGAKMIHVGKNTSSTILSKSISKDGGIAHYRGLVTVKKSATGSTTKTICDGLIMDKESQSNTIPAMDVGTNDCVGSHEASVGRINEEHLFYIMSRGVDEKTATNMIVSGFIEPITKTLPLEYAVELNRLIELELEGTQV